MYDSYFKKRNFQKQTIFFILVNVANDDQLIYEIHLLQTYSLTEVSITLFSNKNYLAINTKIHPF